MGNLKKSDLQIAAVTASGSATRAFSMAHQMGLTKVTLGSKSVPTIQYYTVSGTNTETKGTTEGTTTVTASSTFTGNTMFVSGTTCYAVLPKSTDRDFKGTGMDVWTETYTANAAAGKCCTYTAASKRTFIKKGWLYDYTANNMYSLTISQAGSYKLEAWGAQGGYDKTANVMEYSGYGGYAWRNVNLSSSTTLSVVIGELGKQCAGLNTERTGSGRSYNGGGRGLGGAAGGGGATHIATGNRGVLENYSSNKNEVLLVGAGGGGKHHIAKSFVSYTTMHGGGVEGLPPFGNTSGETASGNFTNATQDSPGTNKSWPSCNGSFGRGGYSYYHDSNIDGGGGGGGWYGGAASAAAGVGHGGGGSSYYGNDNTTGGTTAGGNSMPSTTPGAANAVGHSLNGYARITTNFEWSFE